MKKWYLILIVLALVSWVLFAYSGREIRIQVQKIEQLQILGDPEEKVPEMQSRLYELEGRQTFHGILILLALGTLGGIFIATVALPAFAHRLVHSAFGSNAELDAEERSVAHVLLAQGNFEGAIAAFRKEIAKHPGNRIPWLEIAKIHRRNLDDPRGALFAMKDALASRDWPDDDAAYFLSRIAEIYHEGLHDRSSAKSALLQIIEKFPQTPHAANAQQKLKEWENGKA